MKSFVLLLFSIFGMALSQAQVSSYIFSQSNGSYTEITGGTVLATATGNAIGAPSLDSGVFPVTLPFPFTFNNQSYNDISVSVNGYIVFGGTAPTSSTPISGTTVYDGAVAAFGRDINSVFNIGGKTGSLSWNVSGTAPNREVTVQWKDFRPTYTTSTTSAYTFSFQIKLQESTNNISTVYSAGSYLVGTASYANTAQVGLRGATNTDFNNRVSATVDLFSQSSAGTANNEGQAFSTTATPPGMPAEGLTYTWSPPSCSAPGSLFSYSAITNSGFSVSWPASISNAAEGYDVYYSTTNTAPDAFTVLDNTNSVSVPAATLTAVVQNLAVNTQYYVWVRAKCSATDVSAWKAGSTTVKTLCSSVATLFENFDSYGTGSIVPECWGRLAPATSPGSQTISSTTPFSGTRNMYMYASATSNPVTVTLPPFSNINAGTHWLRMRARVSSATGALKVGYLTSPGDASSFVLIQTLNISNTTYDNTSEYTVIVPASVPASAVLAIQNTADAKSYYFDDVYWEPVPTCHAPVNFALSGQTLTSVSLVWSAPAMSTPTNYVVYYNTTGVAPDATTVLDATNSQTVPATSLNTTVSNLTSNMKYYFWVRSVCSASDNSAWSDVVIGHTGYCAPEGAPTATRYLETITTTGAIDNINYSASTYQLYVDNTAVPFTSYPGGTVNFTMDSSTTGTYYYYIWIDLNNDLDFSDAGETILATTSFAASASGTITVPSTVPVGSYRVRFGTSFSGAVGACGTPSNGNYVDYTLNVVTPPNCLAPSGLAVSFFNDTTANLTWTASTSGTITGYQYYYSTTNTAPTASTAETGTFAGGSGVTSGTISGLTANTTYYVWVRTACSATEVSLWNGPITFTTACAAVAAPFTESFSGGALPTCWTSVNPTTSSTSANVFWKFGAGIDYGATNNGKTDGTYAWVDASSPYANEHTVQLYSPLINLTGLAAPAVQFEWYKNHLTSATGTLPAYDNNKLIVEINSGSGWVTIFSDSSNAASWRIVPIPLNSSYVNTTVQLRFTVDKDVAGNGYFYDDLLIDEVKVLEAANLGTAESSGDIKEVKVYPNPFTDILNISDVKDVASITVTDMAGRTVKTIAKPTAQLQLGDLKSGLYLVTLKYKDGSVKTVKAIKK